VLRSIHLRLFMTNILSFWYVNLSGLLSALQNPKNVRMLRTNIKVLKSVGSRTLLLHKIRVKFSTVRYVKLEFPVL